MGSLILSPHELGAQNTWLLGTKVCTMSDEEYYEEEEVTSQTSKKGEGFLKAKKQKGELDEQLREYINEWRKQRGKEEEELKRLKEKQAKRKEIRAEQEKKLAQQKKEEEEKLRKQEAEKKAAEDEEKRKRLEEAEKKRQAMVQAQKEKQQASGKGAKSGGGGGGSNVQDARKEMTKTKEQLEEEKRISLSIRIKPLDVEAMDSDELQAKAKELWETIVRLETEKYDLEERQKRQDYDLKELKERQKQQLRQKAMKKGLDPEALTGKYPPKIRMYSKYERRTDTRTYEDRRKLYEGGWEVVRAEHLQALWKEKYDEWLKRPKTKLPKWFGERPGKKPGDPESPEDEEEGGAEAAPEPYEEEEEEEEEEEKRKRKKKRRKKKEE